MSSGKSWRATDSHLGFLDCCALRVVNSRFKSLWIKQSKDFNLGLPHPREVPLPLGYCGRVSHPLPQKTLKGLGFTLMCNGQIFEILKIFACQKTYTSPALPETNTLLAGVNPAVKALSVLPTHWGMSLFTLLGYHEDGSGPLGWEDPGWGWAVLREEPLEQQCVRRKCELMHVILLLFGG